MRRWLVPLIVGAAAFAFANAGATDPAERHHVGRAERHHFDLPRKDLVHVMFMFMDETATYGGIWHGDNSPEEFAVIVGPLRGDYTPDEALRILLAPVGFAHAWIEHDMLTVASIGDIDRCVKEHGCER